MAIIRKNTFLLDKKNNDNDLKSALTADKLTDEKKDGDYDIYSTLRELGLNLD
jgi:hypothetical protein